MGACTDRPTGRTRPNTRAHCVVAVALMVTIPAFYLELLSPAPGAAGDRALAPLPASTAFAMWWSRRRGQGTPRPKARPLAAVVAGPRVARLGGAAAEFGIDAGARVPPVRRAGDAGAHGWLFSPPADAGQRGLHARPRGGVARVVGPRVLVARTARRKPGRRPLWLAFTTAATVGYGDIVPRPRRRRRSSRSSSCCWASALSLVTASVPRCGSRPRAPHRARGPARPAPPVARGAPRSPSCTDGVAPGNRGPAGTVNQSARRCDCSTSRPSKISVSTVSQGQFDDGRV